MAVKRTFIPDNWNPLQDEYYSPYNSYDSGPGAKLDRNLQFPRRVIHGGGSNQEQYSLYVSGISLSMKEDGLICIFSNFGTVRSVKIIRGKPGAKANVGFVSYSTLQEAQLAILQLHKQYPHYLNVSFAKSSEKGNRVPEITELITHDEEYDPVDNSDFSYINQRAQYMASENFIDDDLEGAVGSALHGYDGYGGLYCDTYEHEIPSAAHMQWTCYRNGHRVGVGGVGRGSHQNHGYRYYVPEITESRRRQIEELIKEKVYYNRKKNGIYEYSEEETEKSDTGPCSYCHRITSVVCEQCSTTFYCSSSCQMRDFSHHKQICSSGKDLRISAEGEKRCVAVKNVGEAISSVNSNENSKSRDKYNTSSHDKKFDVRGTDRGMIHKKSNEVDCRELQKEPNKRMVGSDIKVDTHVRNKSFGTGTDFEGRKGHKRDDRSFKTKNFDNRKNSRYEKPVEVTSRNNEQVDRQNKNCSSSIPAQISYDKKNSTNLKGFQKNKDTVNPSDIIGSLKTSQYESSSVSNRIGSKSSPPYKPNDKNLDSVTQVNLFLPMDVFTEVNISYRVKNGEFWIQKYTDVSSVRNMTVQLEEEIANAELLEAPGLKSKCAAKYANEWYRGRVTSTEPLKVLFVDWGNTEDLSGVDDIKVLPDKFCSIPPMACRIRLKDGTPDEYLNKEEYDSLKVKPLFKASDCALVVEVEKLEDTSKETIVDSCLQGSDGALVVNIEKVEELPSESEVLLEAPTESKFVEEAHRQSIGKASTESLKEACLKTEEPDLCDVTKNPKHDVLEEREELRKFFPTQGLELNKAVQVEINKIEEESCWVILTSEKEKFLELMCTLQTVAEISKPLLPSANVLCLALHENMWSRGFVKNEKTLEVFFFDLGEIAECSLGEIKELPAEFHTSPPALAHKLRFGEETPIKYLDKQECQSLTVKPISKGDDGSWLVQVEESVDSEPTETDEQVNHCTNKNFLRNDIFTEVVLVGNQNDKKDMYYVQPQTMLPTLCEMNVLLTSSGRTEDFVPRVGTICASIFEEIWCRCRVESVSHESVTVFYIDYGNIEENILFERLQPLPEKYKKMPPQAILVKVVQDNCSENLNLYNKYFVRPVSKLPDGTQVVLIREDYIEVEESVISTPAEYQEKHLENETVQLQCVRLLPNTQVKISHIYDTSTVYVQMADKTSLDTIEEILQEIGSYCQTAASIVTQPLVGDLVACKYSKDNNWYRAEILERQEDKFYILFIDYGNKALVTLENIRTLPAKYKKFPAQCVKIGFADCNATELTPAAQQYLFELSHHTFTIDFKGNDLSSVILKAEDGSVVNQKLKDHLIPSWKKALLANEDPTRNKLFFIEDLGITTLSEDKVVKLMTLSYHPPNILTMCNPNTDIYKFVTTTLTDEISDYCSSLPEQSYNPRENELCCVMKRDPKKWYRAVCLESRPTSSLVSLVDYGQNFNALHNCIRRFAPDFISTPAMAFFCYLEGIPELPSEQLIEKVKSIIQQNKVFEVTVNSKGSNGYSIHVPYVINTLKSENLL